ncbi:MAG: hypothetical protein ACO273_14765, partial [Burkholderiales bacterium]
NFFIFILETFAYRSLLSHPLLADLLAGGYPEFARKALEERRLADLPPFTHMALLRAESVHSEAARHFLEEVTALVDARRRELKLAVHSSGVLPAGTARHAGRPLPLATGPERNAEKQPAEPAGRRP